MKDNEAVYTKGSIQGTMLKTAFAMLAGTVAMSGYNIVDTYFVGRLGTEPLAAMGFTFPVIMLVGCVFRGLGIGVMSTAAQALGRGHKPKAQVLVTNGIWLTAGVSILMAALGILTQRWIFGSVMGAKGEVLELVNGYMTIWFAGAFTSSLGMTGNDLLISAGDSRTASTMMVLGLVLNTILDPLLIDPRFADMGIRGAALATVAAQFASAVAVLAILCVKQKLLRLTMYQWKMVRSAWALVVRFAVPATIGMLLMPIGSAVITAITAEFGDEAVAATAASGRLEMLAFVFPMALGISLLPMIGQNYGARLYSRIRTCHRFSMWFAFIFLESMAVIYFLTRRYTVVWFSHEENVQQIMMISLAIIPWGFGMVEIHRFSGFFYTGCGRPTTAAWLNALRIVGLMIPFSFIALWLRSLEGLFLARFAADTIAGVIGWVLSGRMVDHLPADGEPATAGATVDGITKRQHVRRLFATARAQSQIDSESDTQ